MRLLASGIHARRARLESRRVRQHRERHGALDELELCALWPLLALLPLQLRVSGCACGARERVDGAEREMVVLVPILSYCLEMRRWSDPKGSGRGLDGGECKEGEAHCPVQLDCAESER